MKNDTVSLLLPARAARRPASLTVVDEINLIPEEQVWLGGLKSDQTRRAYRHDIRHFVETLDIASYDELRQVTHRHVITWRQIMMDVERLQNSTVRRRLSALSSLFTHLLEHHLVDKSPVLGVDRPYMSREEGTTLAFSQEQARALLDAPDSETIQGLRDRAILAVGLQAGLRRAEIARLVVRDLHVNQGFDALRVVRKGKRKGAVTINPQVAQRIRIYLGKAGHADNLEGPMFRVLRNNQKACGPDAAIRHLDGDAVDRVVRKYAATIALPRDYSAHSMRATFITTALRNGAKFEDVQADAGHANPSTTKLYDKRGYDPEKSASFFANY